MIQKDIIQFFGNIIAYGGSATFIAYSIFKWLGAKWIEDRLNKRLEEYKKQHRQELEDYKFKVNSLFNRISKIHDKEFEVLPELWVRLQKAYGHVVYLTSKVKEYPDLNALSLLELAEFLESSRLLTSHKDKILNSKNKLNDYIETIYFYELDDAEKYLQELKEYLVINKVFLERSLFDLCGKIEKILKEAISEYENRDKITDIDRIIYFSQQIIERIDPIIEEIEVKVQEKLRCHLA